MSVETKLPYLQLTPTLNEHTAFECSTAYTSPEDDDLYLQVCCVAMDITLKLTLEQLESIAKNVNKLLEEQRELRDTERREAIRQRALKLDPECWKSYAGEPKKLKQQMDVRRKAAMENAAREIDRE